MHIGEIQQLLLLETITRRSECGELHVHIIIKLEFILVCIQMPEGMPLRSNHGRFLRIFLGVLEQLSVLQFDLIWNFFIRHVD